MTPLTERVAGVPSEDKVKRGLVASRKSVMGEFALPNGVSTLGGDPEVARMMGEDIRFHSENSQNCRFVILDQMFA